MAQEVYVDSRRVIDVDDRGGKTAALTANTDDNQPTWTDIITFRTRTGSRARLTQVANAVDPGSEAYMTFRVLVNGAPIADPLYSLFGASGSGIGAVGAIYDPGQRMVKPIELPQNAYIQVQATLANAATTTYAAYIRVRVEYVDF